MPSLGNRVRLFTVGDTDSALVNNLVYSLNAAQNCFIFDLDPEGLPLLTAPGEDGRFNEDTLDDELAPRARRRYKGEYPVLFVDLPLRGDLSASFNEDGAILSTYHWREDYGEGQLDAVATFHLVDILLSRRVYTPVHTGQLRQCPSDSCETPADRLAAVAQGDFCHDCRVAVRRGLNNGSISVDEVAALHRLLDSAAGKKRAFVIMPFGHDFDSVYRDGIKPSLDASGWSLVRVDERMDPAEITNLIREEIARARLVVADLTGCNANVFYELGHAHALGIPCVLLTQSIKEVPFDVRQWRLIEYTVEDLEKMRTDLGAAIGLF